MSQTITQDLHIEGMSCQHCVDAVEGALAGLDGVTVQEVGIGRARVAYAGHDVTTGDLEAAVEEAGYSVRSTDRVS